MTAKPDEMYASPSMPDAEGHFGSFGGRYVPETLVHPLQQLEEEYFRAQTDPAFQKELSYYLSEFVGRPTPLYLAERLTRELGGAKIYLKREDLLHTGAHKINNALGQALVTKRMGKKRVIAETGAGMHGVATATAAALFGLTCRVYMGSEDIRRQELNVFRMRAMGAEVFPVESGSRTLKDATNEAMRDWMGSVADTHYIIGSVVGPHPYPDMVARFQSVISRETRAQLLEATGSECPSHVVACVGGGSNAAGAFYHFLDEPSVRIVAVEAAGMGVDSGHSAATTRLGRPGILHGSMSLLMQTDDGQVVEPHSISAGLDYPGIGPMHAHLFESGRGEFHSATDDEALAAAFELSRLEGIIPALETAHALAVLPRLGLQAGDEVVVCLSGRGDKDLATYMQAMETGMDTPKTATP